MKPIFCLDTDEVFKDYDSYLKGKHWKLKKKEFYNHNERKCVKCGKTTELHVHHMTYENIGNESLSDLICLCRDCHNKVHDKKPQKKKKRGRKRKKNKSNPNLVTCSTCKHMVFGYYCNIKNKTAIYKRQHKCKSYKRKF